MKLYSPQVLGPLWGMSELCLNLMKRSKPDAMPKDRHSMGITWLVTLAAIALGIAAAYRLPSCELPWRELVIGFSSCVFIAGLALRWYSIVHLGRFFTVNVAIAADHQLVDSGPYHFVRHPSYAGSLLAVFGFGLSYQNWASLLAIFVPCCAATLWRIHIEEEALLGVLGENATRATGNEPGVLSRLFIELWRHRSEAKNNKTQNKIWEHSVEYFYWSMPLTS